MIKKHSADGSFSQAVKCLPVNPRPETTLLVDRPPLSGTQAGLLSMNLRWRFVRLVE